MAKTQQATTVSYDPTYATPIEALMKQFVRRLRVTQGVAWDLASEYDYYVALARGVRDQIVDRMIATQQAYHDCDTKRVYYLSLEYLLGRHLRHNLVCLGLYDACRAQMDEMGLDLERILTMEPDAGLGNGGLGRLAACYLDSATSLQLPVYGYGIRYEYGIFQQDIWDGWQVERPDYWLRFGSPWEIPRPEFTSPVRMYGRVEERIDERGRYRPVWRDCQTVMGVPFDVPIMAHGVNTVNILRLWSARAFESFDLGAFNRGGYVEAVREQALKETISKVLYPNDETDAGRELRLAQQYFFVACTLGDIIRRYERQYDTFDAFPDKVAIQLNDTHPSVAILELMRVLVDERELRWEKAWDIVQGTFAYTNHTLLPEALEEWAAPLFQRMLPRHWQILCEVNQRFLDGEVSRRWPGEDHRRGRMSLIREGDVQKVRMAHLAIVGSRRVNGVAALHTELIRRNLVPDFAELWPERFINITNGVTPRRWLLVCNPGLASAITRRIGDAWIRDLSQLKKLERYADDAELQSEIRTIKAQAKKRLTAAVQARHGIPVPTDSLYDAQIKRLHEYKRQLLNILQVVMRYHRILDNPGADVVPRVVLFSAKAAPAYRQAKLIIKLIHDVAQTINHDKRVGDRLRVLFLPNYSVSLAEQIIPACDLSEQISLAGTEASGTGNMKFTMNGALTIGTLDGANVEIREAVGPDNFFLFGLTTEEVAERRGAHDPWRVYRSNEGVRRALNAIVHGGFNSGGDHRLYQPIFDALLHHGDAYRLMGDIESYVEAQDRVDALWRNPRAWYRAVILNIARVGHFSSDRSVAEYAEKIWNVAPVPVS